MSKTRKSLNIKLHQRVKKKYNYCFYCGKHLEEREKTVDHVEPISKGGADKEENLVVSCMPCNTNKSDYSLEEFIDLSKNGYFEPEAILKRQKERICCSFVNRIKNEVEFVDKVVDIKDVCISKNITAPKESSVQNRRRKYLETGEFNKTAIAEEVVFKNGDVKYILRQGYINYLILKELKKETMEVRVYTIDRKKERF